MDLLKLQPGDRVGHTDCDFLLFEVTKVVVDEGDEDTPPAVRRVEVVSLRTNGRFDFEDGDRRSNLDKIGPPSRAVWESRYHLTKRQVSDHEAMARRAFADFAIWNGHRDVYPGVRRWHFRNSDGCGHHSFDLVAWGSYLFVGGDIGEVVWRRTGDMLRWAAGAINSIDYFAEKVPSHIPTEEFGGEQAKSWVWEEYATQAEELLLGSGLRGDPELGDLKETRDEMLSAAESGREEFVRAFDDSGWYDGDFPSVERYTYTFLWARSAVKVALRLLGYKVVE